MERNSEKRIERIAVRLASSWIFSLTAVTLLNLGNIKDKAYGLDALPEGLAFIALNFIVVTFVSFIPWFRQKVDYIVLLVMSFFAALVFTLRIQEFIFSAALVAILCGITVFCFGKGRLAVPESDLDGKVSLSIVVGAALFSALFIGAFTVFRYLSFSASNFDFGIFVNMFYNMKERFLPLVTCERDTLLSHFAVHLSPAYYLLLPFYMIFPSPVTLLVLQAAVIVSGVIPLWLIIKKYKLPNYALAFICVAYLLYPALTGGAFYDFHENKMLTALMLWMLYFYEKRKIALMYVFAALVCMVKEDAPVYIAVIGLYLLISKKEYKHGSIIFLGAVAYFAGAVAILNNFGKGVMTWRYGNISDNGFFGIIAAVVTNPARIIYECLDGEKILFLFQMLLPLLFLPLITNKISRYILLIPFVLVNLMPDYGYQHSIYFQYTYGVSALLFYLTVVNLSDMRDEFRKMLPIAVAMSAVITYSATMASKTNYYRSYVQSCDTRAAINEVLNEIPKDAGVTASTFLLPHIANRDEIYQYKSKNETEYIVLDIRWMSETDKNTEFKSITNKGYRLVSIKENVIALFKKD